MIFIRADANGIMGSGHVMRCLSVAHAFKRMHQEVLFITADPWSNKLIDNKGFDTVCLNSAFDDPDSELSKISKIIEKNKPELLLVDSYYVTEKYFNSLSGIVRTAYMDDLNKQVWNTDVLINYNIFSSVYDYSGYKNTKLLLGMKYAPLRTEFEGLKKHEIKEKVSDVLVSVGGADPEGVTEKIISSVCSSYEGIRFHIVVGALNSGIEKIKAMAAGSLSENQFAQSARHYFTGDGQSAGNIILHINETHMSKLMMSCDAALAAAGSTLYELCACGVPTVTFGLADNQLTAIEEFGHRELMISAGDCRENSNFTFDAERALFKLINDRTMREKMSLKMQTLVDGKGADRIAEELLLEDTG